MDASSGGSWVHFQKEKPARTGENGNCRFRMSSSASGNTAVASIVGSSLVGGNAAASFH